VSTQPGNLGDIIHNRNIIRVFGQLGSVIVDDHYLEEKYCRPLGVCRAQMLSINRSLPDLRKLSGIVKLMLGRSKPYVAVVRVATAQWYRYDIRSIIYEFTVLLIFTLLHFRGIEIYQFGMTSQPSKLHGVLLRIERAKSRMHRIYGVRDIIVYEQLKSLAFCNLFYCPDIFYWDTPRACHHDTIARREAMPTILISLRKNIPDHPSQPDYENKLTEKASRIVDSFPPDARVVFSYQVPMDYEINRRLFEKHKARGNCHFVESCLDEHAAGSLYSESSLIISNRQHCLLYGAKLGVPILALTDTNWHWKLCGALHDLGIPEYLADINEDDEDVIGKCKRILQEESSISKKLITAVEKKRDEAMRFLRERFNLPELVTV